jgi:hypothetical protein
MVDARLYPSTLVAEYHEDRVVEVLGGEQPPAVRGRTTRGERSARVRRRAATACHRRGFRVSRSAQMSTGSPLVPAAGSPSGGLLGPEV